MENKKYNGGVIEKQTSDIEFFTKAIDSDKFEGLNGIDKKAKSGDIDGAVAQFGSFLRSFLNPELFADHIPFVGGENFEINETREHVIERIMNNHLISCGVHCQYDKETVDWEYNPTPNNFREFTWQLQRHHEFRFLAYEYRATGDEKYARKFRTFIMDWIYQSAPAPMDVDGGQTNFWRTIECGIRMFENWPMPIFTFIKSKEMTDRDWVNIFKCIYEHGLRLRKHYTTSNWLIMEMNGLTHIALLYPFFKLADEWRKFAAGVLADQINGQVYPDGFQQELTTGYHNVVVMNYEAVLSIYEKVGKKPPENILSALEKMYDVYPKIVMPNLKTPDLNDGAELATSGTLQVAVKLFPERQDFKYLQTDRREGTPPKETSLMTPYSGYAIMRSDWSENAFWCLFEDAPLGFGHQHEDKLEVLLYAYGKYLMPEAGRNAYDASERHWYSLSSQGHNTVVVDECGQCRRDHYKFEPDTLSKISELKFKIEEDYESAEGVYDEKYGSDCIDVVHKRRVLYLKHPTSTHPLLVVIDRMNSLDSQVHKYTAIWHFQDEKYTCKNNSVTVRYSDDVGIKVVTTADETEVVRAREDPYQGFKCNAVADIVEALPAALCSLKGKDTRFVTVFEPVPSGEFHIESVEASRNNEDSIISIKLANGECIKLDENSYFGF